MKPVYKHDCDKCHYLGTVEETISPQAGVKKYDLYCCTGESKTVIARWGNHGDYMSGLVFASIHPVLAIATVRAIAKGLLTMEDLKKIDFFK